MNDDDMGRVALQPFGITIDRTSVAMGPLEGPEITFGLCSEHFVRD